MQTDTILKIAVTISLLLAGSGIFYYFAVYLPARDTRIETQRRSDEIAVQAERCRKLTADEWSKSGNSQNMKLSDGTAFSSYQAHFSPELHKCFGLTLMQSFHTEAAPPFEDEMLVLYDLSGNKEYGTYFERSDMPAPMDCRVIGKRCQSREEWEALAKPYIGGLEPDRPTAKQ